MGACTLIVPTILCKYKVFYNFKDTDAMNIKLNIYNEFEATIVKGYITIYWGLCFDSKIWIRSEMSFANPIAVEFHFLFNLI